MTKGSTNTHRREMRAVTPATTIGRNVAGATVAAGLLLTGSNIAIADEAPNIQAAPSGQAVLQVPAAPAVQLPAVTEQQDAAVAGISDDADDAGLSIAKTKVKKSVRSANYRAQGSSDDSGSAGNQVVAGSSIISTARNGIGVRYVWGGSSTSGWDCSGFTAWVYAQHGISLPHSASAQAAMGRHISKSEARPGDLVYKPGHIGIYAGNGMIIDAGNSIKDTSERKLWSGNWSYIRIGR
ncbi:C40 family peptidase [Devriesea agamarum]|uniref:C40 family peptidase n=1 Tax=Devriesea agamarum TaxID=472569 RepID=UPI00071CC48E|nr:C40 family peptidase [Devriesea agamarum]